MGRTVNASDWLPLPPAVEARIHRTMGSWEGTPYLHGHRIKGMGVDCYQIVAGFLDDMFGAPAGHTKLPRLSAQIARNKPDIARQAIKRLCRAHEGSPPVTGGIEPGDIMVVRSIIRTDGHEFEGHTLIAGTVPGTVLHAIQPSVTWSSSEGRDIIRVYRPKGKHRWI